MEQVGPIFRFRISAGQSLQGGDMGALVVLLGGAGCQQLVQALRRTLAVLFIGADRLVAGLGAIREVIVLEIGLGQQVTHRKIGSAGPGFQVTL